MKNLILMLLFALCTTVNASQDDMFREESIKIVKLDDDKKLKACSDKGNHYCAGWLGGKYFDKKDYKSAYPLLLDCAKKTKRGYCGFLLGLMFDNGMGVLQNNEKALKFYEDAARKGEPAAAYNISVIFQNKAFSLQNSYRENEIALYKYNLMMSYSWHKVSQAMGITEMTLKNSDKQPSWKAIDEFQRVLIQRGWLNEADNISKEICSTIPSCIQ